MNDNENNTLWLDEVPLDDDVWQQMLVDDELTQPQRENFLSDVAKRNRWQALAVAFLDDQLLKRTLPSVQPPAPTTSASRKPRSSVGFLRMACVIAASLMAGLFLGRFSTGLPQPTPGVTVASTIDNTTTSGSPLGKPGATNASTSHQSALDSSALQASLPAMFQLSNTIDEAVYYTDHTVPDFLLDALVIAGHRVELDQEFLGYTESQDSPLAVPINVVRIRKYGRLLAAADTSSQPNSSGIQQ